MANVSTNGIKGCAAEISSVINITTSIADKVQAACSDISSANSMLKSYNGAVVKGTREDKTTKNSDGLNIKQTYANFWKITGLGGDGNVSVLNDLSNEVNSIISTVKSQVSDIEGIASAIDSYINSINTQLSEVGPALLTSDMLSAAYLAIGKDGVAKANLATSGEDINNRNFINYSDIKDNGLANTKLNFVLQDDGSYRVYSNGKETEFYTTGLAAAFYQKSLKRAYDNVYSSTKSESDKNSDNSTEFKDGSNVVVDKDIKESVKKEIAKYSTVLTSSRASEADKKQAYNNLSTEAKSIVDGKIKILSTEEDTQSTASPTTDNNNIKNTSKSTNIPTEIVVKQNGYYGKKEVYQGKYIYDGKKNYYRIDTLNKPYSTITTTVNGQKVINTPYTAEELNNLTTFTKNGSSGKF